ncbi:ATP-binding protein [Patescibacteria group bacterium]|nr:ATP-binding protein [Patescibacteria group bacterium]
MEVTTKLLSIQEIEEIIKNNDPSLFIGALETSYFEFREKPYFEEEKSGKDWAKYKSRTELLKDISSISNSGGGYLLIGLVPDTVKGRQVEYVKSVCGIEAKALDIERWLDILSDGLVPRFPREKIASGFVSKDKEVLWIKIPNAKDMGLYPFIIPQDQWNPKEEIVLKGQVYGIYTRDGAKNIQLVDAHKFQEYVAGVLSGSMTNVSVENQISRLSAIADRIEESQTKSAIQPPDVEQKKRIVEEFINKLDAEADVFYMVATPTRGVTLNNFWDKSDGSIYHHMKNPPILRNMGWDLSVAYSEYPQPEGNSWEVMNGNRKILKVTKNGIVAAGANIQEFLDWGLQDDEKNEGKKLLNAFAFVEYVNSFFLFIKALINAGIIDKERLSYDVEIGFITKNGGKYSLVLTVNNFIRSNVGTQKKDNWQFGPYDTEDLIKSEKIAGSIIQDIYASGFGFVPDSHHEPYIQKTDDGVIVNEELYRKQK